MSCKYFGTDGIRDRVDSALMQEDFLRRLGYALGRYLEKKYPDQPRALMIGRDTRASGSRIKEIISEGLCVRDTIIYCLGVVPTPATAMAVKTHNAQLGIVITASHNPCEYNGIKLFNAEGMKLPESEEVLIERFIDEARPPQDRKGRATVYEHPFEDHYVNFVGSSMDKGCLQGLNIVLDTANGATTSTTRRVLEHLGAKLICIGNDPDGENINLGVGSEHPEKMAALVKAQKADLGVAHDGDGDRLIVADEKGQVLAGEEILGILALDMLKRGKLNQNLLVTTILSNTGLDFALEQAGGRVIRTDVGDRHVLYGMVQHGAVLGGEASGHFICMDELNTGDGLIALIQLIRVMLKSTQPLSVLRKQITLFPSKTANIMVEEKRPLEELTNLQTAINKVNQVLAGKGQCLVRYSGTEPKIRLLVEAQDEETAQACMDNLKQALAREPHLVS